MARAAKNRLSRPASAARADADLDALAAERRPSRSCRRQCSARPAPWPCPFFSTLMALAGHSGRTCNSAAFSGMVNQSQMTPKAPCRLARRGVASQRSRVRQEPKFRSPRTGRGEPMSLCKQRRATPVPVSRTSCAASDATFRRAASRGTPRRSAGSRVLMRLAHLLALVLAVDWPRFSPCAPRWWSSAAAPPPMHPPGQVITR